MFTGGFLPGDGGLSVDMFTSVGVALADLVIIGYEVVY